MGLKVLFACTVIACDKICGGGRHREGKWGRGGVLNSPRANSSATVQIGKENIVVQYSGGRGGFVPYSSNCTLYKMANDDTTAGRLWLPAFTAGKRDCQRYSGYQSKLIADGYEFLWNILYLALTVGN